jgi:hypothetical protein
MSSYCFPEVRSRCSTGFWFPKSLESLLRLSLVYCNTKDNPLQTSGFPIIRIIKIGQVFLDVAQLSGVVGRCCNVPQNVGWIANWVPQPRGPIQRDPAPSRLRGGRRETKKVIAREDGDTYIAALRSPDLRHTTKREGDTSVTSVTNNHHHHRDRSRVPGAWVMYIKVF